jgi:menaquinone-dependent protoporphyrinogen IX oxidase
VAFATSKGSTSEIAEAIASEIGAAGWQAEAVNLKDSPLTDGYDHVILGGPIYYGKTKEMKAFVEKHGADLENRLARGLCRGNGFRC